MKAELKIMADWSTNKFYLTTIIDSEVITVNITEDEFKKYERIKSIKIEDLPF